MKNVPICNKKEIQEGVQCWVADSNKYYYEDSQQKNALRTVSVNY